MMRSVSIFVALVLAWLLAVAVVAVFGERHSIELNLHPGLTITATKVYGADGGLRFLEHGGPRAVDNRANMLLAASMDGTKIYESSNLGTSWRLVFDGNHTDPAPDFRHAFTTISGSHLLWDSDNRRMLRFDKNWSNLTYPESGRFPWHGTYSIDDNGEFILYAEYGDTADQFYVWRSDDDGRTWQAVFAAASRQNVAPEIRHFHTLTHDPYVERHWHLSSGDSVEESKVWATKDDGRNWANVNDPDPEGYGGQDIHRFTALAYKPDALYWATDDALDGRSRLVQAKRGQPLSVKTLALMGEASRSLISFKGGALFVSEAKGESAVMPESTADVYYSPDFLSVIRAGELKVVKKTGVTFSRSSRSTTGNVFFTYGDSQEIVNFSPVSRRFFSGVFLHLLERVLAGPLCSLAPNCNPRSQLLRWEISTSAGVG